MGGFLAPIVAVVVTLGLWAQYQNVNSMVTPSKYTVQSTTDATTFLAYRNAVMAFMSANPGFTGSVPITSLAVQIPTSFGAGNYVSAFGTTGRTITCWASVPPGTVQQAVTQAGVDPSLGTSNGSTWVSAAPGANATPVALSTPVPAGDIVSVIQIGS